VAALIFLLVTAVITGFPFTCSRLGNGPIRMIGLAFAFLPPSSFILAGLFDLLSAKPVDHLSDFSPWESLLIVAFMAAAWLALAGTGYRVGILLKRDGMGSSSDASP
jgi:hypothetical protein